MIFGKYEDIGDMTKKLASNENPDPVELLFCLKEWEKVGIAINDSFLNEDEVKLVLDSEGITSEIIMKVVDKFLECVGDVIKNK